MDRMEPLWYLYSVKVTGSEPSSESSASLLAAVKLFVRILFFLCVNFLSDRNFDFGTAVMSRRRCWRTAGNYN